MRGVNPKKDNFRMILLFFAGLVGLLSMTMRKVMREPEFALKISNFLNSFDDNSEFNRNHNDFLRGIFAPVDEEHFNHPTTILSGQIPEDVEGLFLRIGPNPISNHISRAYHWFDGHGMLHSMRILNGQAVYSNQWIETETYRLARKYDQTVFPQLGELHGIIGIVKAVLLFPLIRKAFKTKGPDEGTANTVINFYDNRIFTSQEASFPFEIQWEANNTFHSLGFERFGNTLNYPMTAHVKKDPEDGHLYFNGYSAEPDRPAMKYGKLFQQNVETYFDVNAKVRSFAHDMAITENYALLVESSNVYDVFRMISDKFLLGFDEKHKLRIGLVAKSVEGKDISAANVVEWFEFEKPYGLIHTMNAWEEGDEVVLIAPLSESFSGFDPRDASSIVHEWIMAELRINRLTGQTSVKMFDSDSWVEFPNVHPAYLGRKVQHGFASNFVPGSKGFESIIKFDLIATKEVGKISLPEGFICGDVVLVPKKTSSRMLNSVPSGDDVYLATFATHNTTLETQWFLYDGETMSNEPVVKIGMNGIRVPMGFHGLWINEADLQLHMAKLKTPN